MKQDPELTQYKLIFMDESMPEIDGIETTKRINGQFLEKGIYPYTSS